MLAFDIGLWGVFTYVLPVQLLTWLSVSVVGVIALYADSRIALSPVCNTLTFINLANLKLPFQNPHREASFYYVASIGTFILSDNCL